MKKIAKILAVSTILLISAIVFAPTSTADPFDSDGGDDNPNIDGRILNSLIPEIRVVYPPWHYNEYTPVIH
jgi:hypothetical protein